MFTTQMRENGFPAVGSLLSVLLLTAGGRGGGRGGEGGGGGGGGEGGRE